MARASEVGDLLKGLVGQPAWSAIIGPKGDYVLSIELGEKQRRQMRLANPRLSFLQRTYEGAHNLLIECPWRLDGPRGVVTTAFEAIDHAGPQLLELGEIVDHEIEKVEVTPPGYDLCLRFTGKFVLRAFAVEARKKGGRSNWSYWGPSGLVTIGAKGKVVEQSRADAQKGFEKFVKSLGDEEPEPPKKP